MFSTGYRELLFAVPELIPDRLLIEVKSALSSDDQEYNYALLGLKAALAYLHYRRGEVC